MLKMWRRINMAKRKFTWIDFAIIIVIVAGIVGVGYKFAKSRVAAPTADKEKILITYYMEYAPDSSIESIKVGDPVRESVQNSNFGKITEIVTGESIFWDCDDEGQQIASPREGFSSLLLTMEAEGIMNNNGVSIDKSVYYVGQTINIYAGKSTFVAGRISDIAKAQ
jgi:hypothetical protein